jgi:hypothetical protein
LFLDVKVAKRTNSPVEDPDDAAKEAKKLKPNADDDGSEDKHDFDACLRSRDGDPENGSCTRCLRELRRIIRPIQFMTVSSQTLSTGFIIAFAR